MTSNRNLNRNLDRSPLRYSSRMLDGVHRPPRPNYLRIACRALEEVFKIDLRLRPYIEEQVRLQKERERHAPIEALLEKVYGPDYTPPPTPDPVHALALSGVPSPAGAGDRRPGEGCGDRNTLQERGWA